MNKTKKWVICILIPAVIVVLAICMLAISNIYSKPRYHLTMEEIVSMREQYPVYDGNPPMLSMVDISLNDLKKITDSFVYGEVTGDASTYSFVNLTGDAEWDNKMAQVSPNNKTTFFEYPITVISDSEGKYKEGEKITITANTIFKDYLPKLTKGMKVVVPVVRDKDKKGRTHYCLDGMYYITDEGYAISAFDESTAQMKISYNGIKVEDLLKQLKK